MSGEEQQQLAITVQLQKTVRVQVTGKTSEEIQAKMKELTTDTAMAILLFNAPVLVVQDFVQTLPGDSVLEMIRSAALEQTAPATTTH